MADIDLSSVNSAWNTVLTLLLGALLYIFRKRDADIDEHSKALDDAQKDNARLELKMAENFATKQSLVALFQETTRTNKEGMDRVNSRIDETKDELKNTNTKLDNMQATILQAISQK